MPKYMANVVNNQLLVDVIVSKKPILISNINQEKSFKALIDTGAQFTSITKKVVDKVGLLPIGTISMISASHQVMVNSYKANIILPITEMFFDEKDGHVESLNIRNFLTDVSEMPLSQATFDVLLGMDILQSCLFILNGKQFTIAF